MLIHVALTSSRSLFPVNTVDRFESHCFWAPLLACCVGERCSPSFYMPHVWYRDGHAPTLCLTCFGWVALKLQRKTEKEPWLYFLVEWSLLDKPHLALSFLEEVRKVENLPSSALSLEPSFMNTFSDGTLRFPNHWFGYRFFFIDFYFRLNIDLLFVDEVVTVSGHYDIF